LTDNNLLLVRSIDRPMVMKCHSYITRLITKSNDCDESQWTKTETSVHYLFVSGIVV